MIGGLIALMDSAAGFTGPVNLGNPRESTITELAAMIVEISGSRSTVQHHERPEDDPLRRMPDIGLARQMLGWSPTVGLRDGLSRTIDYFRRVIGAKPKPRLIAGSDPRP
jgi:UDP-glucuronate decarboxylase